MNNDAHNFKALKHACKDLGYQFRYIEEPFLAEVSNNKKVLVVNGYNIYGLNQHWNTLLVKDKGFTYSFLKDKGYKVPQSFYVYLHKDYFLNSNNSIDKAVEFAEKNTYPVFVKPNSESKGRGCKTIHSSKELIEHLEYLKSVDDIAIVQEFLEQKEFRVFVIDGKVEVIYIKQKPQLTGDGKTSIIHLLELFNSKHDTTFDIQDSAIQLQLQQHHKTEQDILEKEKTIILSDVSNICSGGTIDTLLTKAPEKLQTWIQELYTLTGLRIFGLDLLTASDINSPEDFYILEINANPSLKTLYDLGHVDLVLGIFKKSLRLFFQDQ